MQKDTSKEKIEKLVEQAKAGNEKSFSEIFRSFFDKIFRYVHFRVEKNEVEDIVSDIFLKVVEKLDSYHSQKGIGFNAWIFRIAHNTIIDFYRKKKELLGIEDENQESIILQIPDENFTPDQETDQGLNYKKLRDILATLPSLQRDILELKYLEGFSNTEISKITGKTEGNIRVIQLRALREIRKKWGQKEY
jgi:RNA polymerase sigma-70 factor (ECF subfamily)